MPKKLKIEENFHRYGVWVLLFARLLPTIRSPIYIMAGVVRVPVSLFLRWSTVLVAIFWGFSLLFFLGYWLGDQFKDLIQAFEGKMVPPHWAYSRSSRLGCTHRLLWSITSSAIRWLPGDPRLEVPGNRREGGEAYPTQRIRRSAA